MINSQNKYRKTAYEYIVNMVKTNVNWIPPINSDERLADLLNVPLDDIISLKNGDANPSGKLVSEFKKLMGPLAIEEQIDHYLISPFQTK
jgi:hypothetical protein